MSTVCGNPPPPFYSGPNQPSIKWEKWYRQFNNYLLAVNGDSFNAKRKKALLLNTLGSHADDVFEHLPPSPTPTGMESGDYDCFTA